MTTTDPPPTRLDCATAAVVRTRSRNLNVLLLGGAAERVAVLDAAAEALHGGTARRLDVDRRPVEPAEVVGEAASLFAGERIAAEEVPALHVGLRALNDAVYAAIDPSACGMEGRMRRGFNPLAAATLLVEGTDPDAAWRLFGRFRDELWELPLKWVVAGDSACRAKYLRRPADAFFDALVDMTSA